MESIKINERYVFDKDGNAHKLPSFWQRYQLERQVRVAEKRLKQARQHLTDCEWQLFLAKNTRPGDIELDDITVIE